MTNTDGFLGSHFKRVIGYARTSDYVAGATSAAFAPAALYALERLAPSHVGRGGFAKAMRLAGFIGLAGGFLYFYQRSARTFLFTRPLIFYVGVLSSETLFDCWTTTTEIVVTDSLKPLYSSILRRYRELKGSRDGYARDGFQGQGGTASVWREQAEPAPAGRCGPTEQILCALLQHSTVVQLCQPQPARRGHGQVLSAGREGTGSRAGGGQELDGTKCVYFSGNTASGGEEKLLQDSTSMGTAH